MSSSLEQDIASVVAMLREPLRPDEAAAGWTKAVKTGYVNVFSELLERVRQSGNVGYFGIARSLDAYGIGDGELYERMLEIANETNAQLR